MRYLRLKGVYGLFACLGIGLFLVLLPDNLEAQVEDTTPPELVDFFFSPTMVDVAVGVATVIGTVQFTDDISGVRTSDVVFRSPSGLQASTSTHTLISGTANDGVHEDLIPIPQFSEVGTWVVSAVQLWDETGNTIRYLTDDLVALGFPTELEVVSVIEVDIDIKPRSCPNPLNTKSKGVLPVAILGTYDFDVYDIDVASIRLEGVNPIRSSYEDVSTPFDGELCYCHELGADGLDDLTLKFDTQEILAVLGDINDGDELVVALTGELYNGAPIEGQDCVLILDKGKKNNKKKGK